MPLIEVCEGCNVKKAVEIIGSFRSEMALCRSCREVLKEVDGDLIELWARTGIRRRQVLEDRIVAAFAAQGLELAYRDDVPPAERRYRPEWRAAKAAIGEVESLFEFAVD
jgi:hypothetical protein